MQSFDPNRKHTARVERLALSRRILTSLGLASVGAAALLTAACGDDASAGGAGGGTTTSTSASTGTKASSSASGATKASTSASGNTASNGTSASTADASATSSAATGMTGVERCFFYDAGECPGAGDAVAVFGSCTLEGEVILSWNGEATLMGTECCYPVDVGPAGDPTCGGIGRPFMVEDRAIAAPTVARETSWARSAEPIGDPWRAREDVSVRADATGLSEAARLAIGGAWASDAAYEHASVGSFSKLSIELVALGAPPELIEASHRAALDEVHHARLCYALASAYHDAEVGPGPLAEATRLTFATDLGDLVDAAVREGCFGETLASLVAREQLAGAEDPAVRAALAQIAEDEASHAELAFRVVAWAVQVGGEAVADRARAAAREAHLAIAAAAGEHANEATVDGAVLARHGRISAGEALRVRLDAADAVVAPALAALLG